MLAYHPITGKEIRIIQTEASISKKRKTLSVGKVTKGCVSLTADKLKGDIWDSVGTETNEQTTFSVVLGTIEDGELVQRSEQSRLVFIQKEANPQLTVKKLQELGIQNMICLEEMKDLYPHLGAPWDGTKEDAFVLVAGLMRYRYIANQPLTQRAKELGIEEETQKSPMRLWWVTQYYKPAQAKRRREIDICLERNNNSELIDHILLLNEKEETLPVTNTSRIQQKVIGHRLTYKDVMEAAKDMSDDVLLVFANADICIDDTTWSQLWSVDMTNKCFALLRWDVPEDGNVEKAKLFGPRADSQDTWVVRVADVKARKSWEGIQGIPFGQMGCDNAFALEMFKAKFSVINPALSLKTYHFHSSSIRNYDNKNVVERPAFLYIQPTGIHDLEPVFTRWPEKSVIAKSIPPPLTRKLEGSGAQVWMERFNKTLKVGDTAWTKLGTNSLQSSPEIVIQLQNVWESEEGLCYDKENLYIGPGQEAQAVWSKAQLRSLSPSILSKEAVIVPITKNAMESRENYIVQYLSKVLRLRLVSVGGTNQEFLCPESKEFVDSLQMFDWGSSRIPVLKYEKDQQIWCEKATMTPVSDNQHVLPDDITALRQKVRGWKEEPLQDEDGKRTLIFVEDGKELTEEMITSWEEALEGIWKIRVIYPGRTSPERLWESLRGAWGIVFSSSLGVKGYGWNWLLPKGAHVFEVVGKSSNIGADGITFSAAAELHHILVKSPKEFLDDLDIHAAFQTKSSEPILWLPRRDMEGYFAHAGDSFREMARLWSARNYIVVKEHPTATMCWWNSVGQDGVLLYDRPTHEWRLAAPAAEKSYRGALYGNPKPPEGVAKNSPWFFWPRRPELVEELVAAGVSQRGWQDRLVGPVFYGKIENKVQEKRRVGAKQPDWSSACSSENGGEWVMVKGAETKYPFTQKEYLEKLSKARFGLCLPGYGLKCHREVECMAMGCVPLVAPDVDMDSYANPPQHGVQYLRVETPEAAVAATKMSRERWEEMSKACRKWWEENASAAGSFALTKKLIQSME